MTSTFRPTPEQQAAIDLFSTGRSLAIEAGAGTGKTSTLRLLAESTTRRGQYIAFNRPIVEESKLKMPGNVRCNTAHSLAMREVGRKYSHRLPAIRMRSLDLADRLGVDAINVTLADGARRQLSRSFLAGLAVRGAVRFCQTADLAPTWRHVPLVDGLDLPGQGYEINRQVAREVEPLVQRVWADWDDPNGALPYRHDHYLKAWQLSDPRIGADFIMFDEAQDASPVMVAIVAAQSHAQLVWVGDSQQQIYTFTGAVNALATVPAESRTFLTQSFRFGPAIAQVANTILAALPDAELRLRGTESIPSRVERLARPSAILTRTNAAAMRAVLQAIQDGIKVHLVGGGAEISAFAKAARSLQAGERTDHPELACFDTWAEVQEYVALDEQGGDLRLLVALVDEFGVEAILQAVDSSSTEASAELVVSTAHKSKGREWDRVKLGDDFPETPKGEELRLLYVAATRAKLTLDLTAVSYLSLRAISERLELGEGDHLAADHDHAACPVCNAQARSAEVEAEGELAETHDEAIARVRATAAAVRSSR